LKIITYNFEFLDGTTSNTEADIAHREVFLRALEEHYDKLDSFHLQNKSRLEYEEIIAFLKGPGPKDKNKKKQRHSIMQWKIML
jgi:hypothetical protein